MLIIIGVVGQFALSKYCISYGSATFIARFCLYSLFFFNCFLFAWISLFSLPKLFIIPSIFTKMQNLWRIVTLFRLGQLANPSCMLEAITLLCVISLIVGYLQNVGILCWFVHDHSLAEFLNPSCNLWSYWICLYCIVWSHCWTMCREVNIC